MKKEGELWQNTRKESRREEEEDTVREVKGKGRTRGYNTLAEMKQERTTQERKAKGKGRRRLRHTER